MFQTNDKYSHFRSLNIKTYLNIALSIFHIRRVAICKPGKPGLTSFSETLALFFIQFLSFQKMKVQDRQNGPSGLPKKTGWLRACIIILFNLQKCLIKGQNMGCFTI